VENVGKTYQGIHGPVTVLREVHFSIGKGETAAVVGPSGSGKTTLLSLCAGLDLPTTGEITFLGQALQKLSEDARAQFRIDNLGFIFQSFHLMPSLTALENVLLPMELKGRPDRRAAKDLLVNVGLAERMDHYPSQLSGGERQRVGVARAFANRPLFLFADEPTGNLDRETSGLIEELIFNLNRELGTTLLVITHDMELAARAMRTFEIREGKLHEAEKLAETELAGALIDP
jgi:putative ABC transport system ATP-binding protein